MHWHVQSLQMEGSIHSSFINSELNWLGELILFTLSGGHFDGSILHRKEFEQHGLEGVVTVTCRDVCAEGFGLEDVADAGNLLICSLLLHDNVTIITVFLDLPMPWKAIQSARTALKVSKH